VTRCPESARIGRALRWYRGLLLAYPRIFRDRFADDLIELFADLYREQALSSRVHVRLLFWIRIVNDTCRHATAERRASRRSRLPLGVHRARGPSTMSLLLEDLRTALRALRSQPALTAVVVITLALGIGANSAIFTVVNAVLLRPLPFTAPERVVMLYEVDPRGRDTFVSMPAYDDFRSGLKTIAGLSVMGSQTANLTGSGEPDRLRAGFVTAGFFDMLDVPPIVGRGFRDGDDRPGAGKTAVLDYGTWQRKFGGDPSMIGRSLVLNNEPHEIIGVLPPRFEFPIDSIDVWMPLTSGPTINPIRRNRNFMVFGRVKAEASFEEAASELRTLAANLASAYPDTNHRWSARFEPFHDVTVRLVSRNLKMLTGAAAFVLLIACANIANLLLVRASGRQREIALRAALGASRGRLLRQLLTESVVMAAAGGALGLVLSATLTDTILRLIPNLPRGSQVAPDATVVVFTATVSIVTGILFGSAPAWRISRTDVRATLSESTRTGDGRAAGRLRSALIVCELAMSLMLLVGAALLVQSLYRVLTVDIGYRPENLLTLEYRLPRNKYQTPKQQWDFHQRVVEKVAATPGVEVASLAASAPQSGNGAFVGFWRSEEPQPPLDAMNRAHFNAVTPQFFRAMSIPLFEGRVCSDAETADSPMKVVVNRHLAERLWPGGSAIGRQLRSPEVPVPVEIIGVVGNTRPQLLSQPVTPQIYGCLSQQPGIFATLIARTRGEPMAVSRSVQEAIWSVDPDQPMWKIRSAEMMVAGSVQTQRFVMLLMSAAAALALLLAALGTYSVLSYTAQRRAREVGVRLALGATRADVLRLMLSQTAILTLVGVAVGLAGALALSRLLAAQLFEVSPYDPFTFAGTALLLASVALVAGWIPARRATSVDPMITLRIE
jgi:putative ABC transport system permease protein